MSTLAAVASRLPVLWVSVYTLGLPAALRMSRRREILSDTFEHVNDPALSAAAGLLAWDITRSLLIGVPDDLRWRATHISVWGTFGQSLIVAVPLAALTGFITYHTTGQLGIAAAVALVVEAATAGSLAGLSLLEVSVNAQDTFENGQQPSIENFLASAALIVFPILLLVAQLIIPFAEGADPVGDKGELVRRADDTTRWVAGYATLGLAVLTAMYGIINLGAVLRQRGSIALGTLGPLIFCVGGLGVITGGPGVIGLGLAHVVDAGLDGNAYLEGSGEAGLIFWWFGSLLAAVGLLVIGYAIWATQILTGLARHACGVAFVLEALAIGLLPGLGGSGVATLPAPIIGLLAFGAVAFALMRSGHGAAHRRSFGTTFANT